MMAFFEIVREFPTNIFFWGYCILLGLMIISLLTGFLGDIHLPFDVDIDLDIDMDADASTSLSAMDILFPARLAKVPFLVSLTIVFFVGAAISLFIQEYLLLLPSFLFWPIAIGALLVILFISLHIAALILKPFEKLFDQSQSFATVKYEGMTGQIKTTKVTEEYGEIAVTEGGREDYLNVYALEENTPLTYGDIALIVSYDKKKQRYLVIKA